VRNIHVALDRLYVVVVLPVCGFISKHQQGLVPSRCESLCCGSLAVGDRSVAYAAGLRLHVYFTQTLELYFIVITF
jgi:hypothetical protein